MLSSKLRSIPWKGGELSCGGVSMCAGKRAACRGRQCTSVHLTVGPSPVIFKVEQHNVI